MDNEILSTHIANAHFNAKYSSYDIQNELIGICAELVKERFLVTVEVVHTLQLL